jgi:uncharacterized protein involved in propanediol utilization
MAIIFLNLTRFDLLFQFQVIKVSSRAFSSCIQLELSDGKYKTGLAVFNQKQINRTIFTPQLAEFAVVEIKKFYLYTEQVQRQRHLKSVKNSRQIIQMIVIPLSTLDFKG